MAYAYIMKKYFILLLLLPNIALGQKYFCTLNIAPAGMTVSSGQIKEYIRTFEYDYSSKSGRSTKIKDISVFIFKSKKRLYVQFEDKKKKLQLVTFFRPSQEEILLKVRPNTEFKCVSGKKLKNGGLGRAESLLHQKMTDETDLQKLGQMVKLEALNNWKIKWFQQNVNGSMRPILWSNGNVYTADNRSKLKNDYCIFNFNLKLTENTFVPKGKVFEPLNMEVYKNNKTHTVYSYSFVDFGSGKKNTGTSRYSPFSFECNVKNEVAFTYGLIKKITGGRLGVKVKR